MNPTVDGHRHLDAVELGASPTSTIAFLAIGAAVSGAVFLAPWLETRRREASLRTALEEPEPTTAPTTAGYEQLREAEQDRAFRIAALMTGRPDRATAIVEETFSRTLQQWTRLPVDGRVWFVLSTDVKLCLGREFVRSLNTPIGPVAGVEGDELFVAAERLSVLEPKRRIVVILSRSEGLTPQEVGRVVGIDPGGVPTELDAAIEQLGPALGAVAA
jgi:DNA-directed RNA polymerase specialized sigma24 family protein